jgi:hypothetical protein
MNRLLILFCLVFIVGLVQAQENGGFEDHESGCKNLPDDPDQGFNSDPFNIGKVADWKASHGTPQITKVGCNATLLDNEVFFGNSSAFIDGTSGNLEGVFQEDLNYKKDESFSYVISAREFVNNARLHVVLTTGLSNAPSQHQGTSIPTVSKQQVVIDTPLTTTWTTFRVEDLVIDDDYDQIWIYATGEAIFVDGLGVKKSCCEPYKLWQNITNPPSTYVNNYIKAGENVDTSQTQGDVLITKDADPIVFQAGETVELHPGFETEVGADFTAEIKPCGETPLQVTIVPSLSEAGLTANEISSWNKDCEERYQVSACYGSGYYDYEWLDGIGSMVPNLSMVLTPSVNRNVRVKVTDQVSGDSFIQTLFVPQQPFHGSFNIDIFNIITPDGDGQDDTLILVDSTRLGLQTFGYNAYYYKLSVFDRYGEEWFVRERTDKTNGFPWNDIIWNQDACDALGGGTAFVVLKLENCSGDDLIEFPLTIVCPSTKHPMLNVVPLEQFEEILLFPNPVKDNLMLMGQLEKANIKLYDQHGREVYSHKNLSGTEHVLQLPDLSSGVYSVAIKGMNNEILSIKRIVVSR